MMNAVKVNSVGGDTVTLSHQAVAALQETLRGDCLAPGHTQYDAARRVWNGLIQRKPGLIVRCRGVSDVMAAVNFAGRHGLTIAVRSGGHNVAGTGVPDNGFTIDLASMRSVRIDPQRRVARVEGGARLGDVDAESQAFGLAVPLGVVSATGVVGLTLHGGIGWLLRRHGLSMDNLLSVDVVTADGSLKRADRRENRDLFWAVRGGGGNFGVVTSFEFKLHPVGPQVWFAAPIYPLERASTVMAEFRAIMDDAPDDLMGLGVYWSAPEVPQVPERHHGTPVVILLGCYTGPVESGEEAVRPLRTIGQPIADLSGRMPWLAVQRFLDADYPDGAHYYWKSIYLDRLDDRVIDTLTRHASGRPSPVSSIDVWTLGRAMGRVPASDSAFYKRDAPYMIGIEANWTAREAGDANIAWARGLYDELKAFTRGGDYLNFPGFFENQTDMLSGAYGSNLARLKSVKRRYDPENLFTGAVNIRPDEPASP